MIVGCFVGSCIAALMVTGGTNGPVTDHNHQVGVYVDNETPRQCEVVTQDYRKRETVFASQWGGFQPIHTCSHSITLVEFYPYWATGGWMPPPCGYPGYIVQYRFGAPTVRQRNRELQAVAACRPKPRFIIRY